MILGSFYHMLSKKIVGSDILVAGSMAFFCLFGAAAVSKDIQGLHMISNLTWTVVLLVFIQVLFLNIVEGGLKDVENDRKTGVKNLAVYLGVETSGRMFIPLSFKSIAIFLNIVTVILILVPFSFYNLEFWYWQMILLGILIFGMFFSSVKLINLKTYDKKKIGRYAGMKEFDTYSIIPIMLIGVIGVSWALFLILLPIVWFILFNYIIFDRLPEPGNFTIPKISFNK